MPREQMEGGRRLCLEKGDVVAGVDALGVSVGNVHILTQGKAGLDLDALARIRDAVQVPLVLHGGTGIDPEHIAASVRLGVAKVNFGTALKQVYLAAVQKKLVQYHEPLSPHPFAGKGGEQDILMAGREAVKQKARELMTRRAQLMHAGGPAPAIAEVWSQLGELQARAKAQFPLQESDVAELRASLQKRVRAIYEGEVAAQQALSAALN